VSISTRLDEEDGDRRRYRHKTGKGFYEYGRPQEGELEESGGELIKWR